jgi:23S rRNA-/tRNA-specific pseudouridylate synthase
MHTAPLKSNEEGTLVAWMISRYPDISRVSGLKPEEPGLLHRLDRETSGLVLFARTEESFERLLSASGLGLVDKRYRALCELGPVLLPPEGFTPEGWKEVLQDQEENEREYRILSRFRPYGPGRKLVQIVPAYTLPGGKKKVSAKLYETSFNILPGEDGYRAVRAHILLGFRHQIRVHLASAGLPIMGDPLYGCSESTVSRETPRMFLHAESLAFAHPASGEPLFLSDPAPF